MLFIVVEFAGGALTEWSFEVAGVIYLVALGGLAREVVAPAPAPATGTR